MTQHPTGHLTAKQFQDLFDVLDQGVRRRARPAMSFVENRVLRNIQILVSNKLFDYTGDFVCAVNVLLVSVSMKAPYWFSEFQTCVTQRNEYSLGMKRGT